MDKYYHCLHCQMMFTSLDHKEMHDIKWHMPQNQLREHSMNCQNCGGGTNTCQCGLRHSGVFGVVNVTPIMDTSVSASKNDQAKLDLSLIPKVALEEAARAFMVGEKKYGRYNYCKGHNVSQLIAAIMRHAAAYNEGEEHDPIDGQHHLGSVIACAAMLLRQAELGTLKDNRFKPESK